MIRVIPVLALTLGACSVVTSPGVPFRHVGSGSFSGLTQSQVRIVRDSAAWESARRQLQFAADDAARAIDFASEAVVIVALGTRPTAGYGVQVDSLRNTGGAYEVFAVEVTPGTCATAQVVTSPFAVIAVPRDVQSVAATWSSRARSSCG